MLAYAGIGSRYITKEEEQLILNISSLLSKKFVVYSGNAEGSDISFQKGSNNNCVVFLPWKTFNRSKYNLENVLDYFIVNDAESIDSVKKYHPRYEMLNNSATSLMARNYRQIMGHGEYPVVKFVLCCADPLRDRTVKGGTGQAVRIANDYNIPVINLRLRGWKYHLTDIVKEILGK